MVILQKQLLDSEVSVMSVSLECLLLKIASLYLRKGLIINIFHYVGPACLKIPHKC